MHQENAPDAEIESWLKTLGIASLCQWDVLVFFQGHPMSLLGPAYLASLLGREIGAVVAALEVLESLSLLERSRVSQEVRMYRFTVPADPERRDALERLFALANSRAGRVVLSKKLRAGDDIPRGGWDGGGSSS
ncbi:MAG TPA: hypothetical protein VND64_20910 [Pirellulales bacterium]|nr:hypothetical protein [Pirellulales bacterium]